MLHFGTAGYFALFPLPVRPQVKTVQNIQDHFATLLVNSEKDAIQAVDIIAGAQRQSAGSGGSTIGGRTSDSAGGPVSAEENALGEGGTGDLPGGGSPSDPSQAATTTSEQISATTPRGSGSGVSRKEMRRQIEQNVSTQGILGALGSSRNSGEDILPGGKGSGGGEGVYNNIEKLSNSGGSLTGRGSGSGDGTGTGTGKGVRGGRRTEGEGIDAYVSDIGNGQSRSLGFKKISDFVSTELAPLDANGEDVEKSGLTTGARDIDEVAAIVYSKSRDVRNCYERVLRVNPDLKGKVVVRFTITPAGNVINPQILSTTLKNESVERCILTRIKTWSGFGAIDKSLGNSIFRQVYTFGF